MCVHLAAQADLYEAERDPTSALRTNVEGTRVVLECCNNCNVRMLFASTCCAYGNNGLDISDELSPTAPTEVYAKTKIDGEAIILESDKTCQLRHAILRLATFYGPGMRGALATARFLNAATTGGVISIHGTGEQTRCFSHVHDIAEGIRVVISARNFSGVVNVADDRECSVNELVRIVMDVAKVCTVRYENDRDGQIKRSKICNRRLRELGNLGWRPTVSLEDGLRDCAQRLAKVNGTQPRSMQSAFNTTACCKLEQATLPVKCGSAILTGNVYTTETFRDQTQLVAYVVGNLNCCQEVAVRIHSECLFGDVFGSLKCDCGQQLSSFLEGIARNQSAVLVYVKGHEGRGAGLMTKTRAYRDVDQHPRKHHNHALLDAGATSIDARCYDAAAALAVRLVVEANVTHQEPGCCKSNAETRLILHTNNRDKVAAITRAISHCTGAQHLLCTQEAMPAGASRNSWNRKYLHEKQVDNGHQGLSVEIPDSVTECGECPGIDDLPGTTTAVNNRVFDVDDPKLLAYYKEHGFVVIRGLVKEQQVKNALRSHDQNARRQFERLCTRVGSEQFTFKDFTSSISQFRDLFLSDDEGNEFRSLTCDNGPTSMSAMARRAMAEIDPDGQWTGVRLLHDHIIVKPAGRASKKIPLHQDTMFWPVDIPACSTWTALTDAPIGSGCMEVTQTVDSYDGRRRLH